MKELSFSFFASVYKDTAERQVSLGELQALIAGDLYRFATSEVRRLAAEGRKEEAKRQKMQLPCVAVAGHFGKRRRMECLVGLNGAMMVDIDHAKRPVAELLAECCTLPYVALGCLSVSGEGLHLLVRVDNDDPVRHRAICLAVAGAIGRLTGEAVDGSCKDVARCMLLNHDEGCYINVDAVPFEMPEVQKDAMPVAGLGRLQGADAALLLEAYLDASERSLSWQPGSRHTSLVSLTGCLNRAGFDEAEAARAIVRRYATPDFASEEIVRTIASIYAAGRADFGRNKGEKKRAERAVSEIGETKPPVISDDEMRDREERKVSERERVKCTLNGFEPIVYERLHPFLAKMIALTEPGRRRDMALIGILTILSTVTPRVRGSYDGKIVHPQFFSVVTAAPGSGKGVLDKIRDIYSGWHRYVRENSRRAVERYEQALLVYARDLAHWQKKKEGTPPEKPEEVKQMELSMKGDTTRAKMIEQLFANGVYPALLHETEMRVIAVAMQQENGKFADVFNRLAHHEEVGRSTKSGGHFSVERPKMGLIACGVPEQIPDLFGDMDDGLASRFMGYMVPDEAQWKGLTDNDDTPDAANYFLQFSEQVKNIGIHLDMHKTFVSFTPEQRERMNRIFSPMVDIAREMGETDRKAFLFRNALSVFRLGMTLSSVRKAIDGVSNEWILIHPDDFEVALSVGLTGLNHMLAISTLLRRGKGAANVKNPNLKQEIFASLPDCFFSDQACAMGLEHLVTKRTVYNWLAGWINTPLLVKVSTGYYEKTQLGKHFSASYIKRG